MRPSAYFSPTWGPTFGDAASRAPSRQKNGGSSTNTRRPMRLGSRSIRNAHSRPKRVIHGGAAGTRSPRMSIGLAQAEHHRLGQLHLVARHPRLLLRRAKADDQDLRLRRDELGRGGRVRGAADLEAHRRADRGHDRWRPSTRELRGGLLRGVVAPADQGDRRRIRRVRRMISSGSRRPCTASWIGVPPRREP